MATGPSLQQKHCQLLPQVLLIGKQHKIVPASASSMGKQTKQTQRPKDVQQLPASSLPVASLHMPANKHTIIMPTNCLPTCLPAPACYQLAYSLPCQPSPL